MNRTEVWKSIDLNEELSVAGTFIYNGLRCFHEMRTLDHTEELFEFLYNLSVGLERLLKVAVVLLEHDEACDPNAFEQSLITHNHEDLFHRVRSHADVALGGPHHQLLKLLSTFYKTLRYDRFNLPSQWNPTAEKEALMAFLANRLGVELTARPGFPTSNTGRFKKHIGNLVGKISSEVYRVIRDRASALNLYTYELRSESKASKIFLSCDRNFDTEEVLWKELLIFFMNSKSNTGTFEFLRSITPLEFDEGRACDYLQCFRSEEGKRYVIEELEQHYANLENVGQRLQAMSAIGDPSVHFDQSAEDEPAAEETDNPTPSEVCDDKVAEQLGFDASDVDAMLED